MRDRESWTEQIEDWWTEEKVGSSADSLIFIIIQHTFIFSWVLFESLGIMGGGGQMVYCGTADDKPAAGERVNSGSR